MKDEICGFPPMDRSHRGMNNAVKILLHARVLLFLKLILRFYLQLIGRDKQIKFVFLFLKASTRKDLPGLVKTRFGVGQKNVQRSNYLHLTN